MTQVQIRRQTRPQQAAAIDRRAPSGRVLPF
jgi:hypothetical protein